MHSANMFGVLMVVLLAVPTEFIGALSTSHVVAASVLVDGDVAARARVSEHHVMADV
jgi:hypothetical protein